MPFWESNVFWGVAGIVVGFLIATIYYFAGKERYSMKHSITTKQIVTREITNIPEIQVSFDGRAIKELTESTIKFINSGNRIITAHDYAAKEPLGVHISGHLYKYSTSAENSNSMPEINSFGSNKYKFEFDFLKPKQSFSVVMFHDGNVTVFGDLVKGKGFGTNRRKKCYHRAKYHRAKYHRATHIDKMSYFLFSVGIFAVIIIFGYFLFTIRPLLFATVGLIFGFILGMAITNIPYCVKRAMSHRAFMEK